MEQTKNEPTKREQGGSRQRASRKRSAKPLTEAQRLKRQKMIVLARYGAGVHRGDVADIRPVLRQGATAGNRRIQHRDARRGQGEPPDYRRQGESLRAWGRWRSVWRAATVPCGQLGDMFDREIAGNGGRDSDFDLANPGGNGGKGSSPPRRRPSNPPQPPTVT